MKRYYRINCTVQEIDPVTEGALGTTVAFGDDVDVDELHDFFARCYLTVNGIVQRRHHLAVDTARVSSSSPSSSDIIDALWDEETGSVAPPVSSATLDWLAHNVIR